MDWTQYFSGEPDPQIYRDILGQDPTGKGLEWLMKYDLLQNKLAEQDRLETQKRATEYMGKTAGGEWTHPDIIRLLSQSYSPGTPQFGSAMNRFAQNERAFSPESARDMQWQRNEGFSPYLTPDDIAEQRLLAQIQNDYSAMAGNLPSAPGVGYLTESPQSAQQNALRNAWMDALAQRMSTPNYDPRYAQQATSFSPQFGGVYIDPMMKGDQEQGFTGRIVPSVETQPMQPSPGMGPMLTAGAGSPRGWESSVEPLARSLPTGTIPEVPQQATDMKSFNKMMEARGKKEEKQREKAQKDYYKTGITEQKMFAAAAKDERIKAEKAKKQQAKEQNAIKKLADRYEKETKFNSSASKIRAGVRQIAEKLSREMKIPVSPVYIRENLERIARIEVTKGTQEALRRLEAEMKKNGLKMR